MKPDKRNIEDIFALTPMQEGMLFQYLKNPGSEYYFEQLTLNLIGEIDAACVESAWNFVTQNNEMLRTFFRWENLEQPVQIVLKTHKVSMDCYDLSTWEDDTQKGYRLEEIKRDDRKRGFHQGKVPFRILLCKNTKIHYHMMVSYHHMLYDGWSNRIILKEFFEAYDDISRGKRLVKPTKTKFKEFVRWIQDQDRDKQEEFWREYLKGVEKSAELPVKNKTTNGKQVSSWENLRVSIKKDTREKLEKFISHHKITMAALLYCTWGILLQKYNNTNDVIFGTTVSGRSAKIQGIENVIGLFINTIPLRLKIMSSQKITGLLYHVNDILTTREKYDSTPLVDIKRYNQLENNSELFDSIVVLENYPLDFGLMGEMSIDSYSIFEATNYDLTVIITIGEYIEINFSYPGKLFEKAVIRGLSCHFINILEHILTDDKRVIPDLEILSREEKRQILDDFNGTAEEYPKDKRLHELFAKQADRTPHHIASIFDVKELTYRELNKRSDQLAEWLRNLGVGPDTLVGIMVERSPAVIIGILGILKASGAYLPIDPNYPEERIRYMLTDSNAKVLVTTTTLPRDSKIGRWEGEMILLKPGFCPGRGEVSSPAPNQVDCNLQPANVFSSTSTYQVSSANLVYIIYTSGSTGKPKGVMVQHQNAVNFITGMTSVIDFLPGKCILALTTISFDIFFLETLLPVTCGMKVVIADESQQKDPQLIEKIIRQQQINMLQLTPSRLQLLLNFKDNLHYLSSVKELLVGGEAFPVHLFEQITGKFTGKIYNVYGPTETTIWTTVKDLTNSSFEELNIGSPIANTRIYIVDQYMRLQPLGVPGELLVGGDGVATGYLNKPQLTAEKFDHDFWDYQDYHDKKKADLLIKNYKLQVTNRNVQNYKQKINQKFLRGGPGGAVFSKSAPPGRRRQKLYKTGDLARWLPDGNIEFLGRRDHQVKIRGFRIELVEIENQLLNYQYIKEAVVTIREDKKDKNGDKYLCAYIVPHSSENFQISHVQDYLARKLPDYMIPAHFVKLEKLPLTPTGKIDRKALPEIEIKSEKQYVAPRDSMETQLVEIWSGVLGIEKEKISINDHFFKLGGHSLKATILILKIHKYLNVNIPLVEIFNNPTIMGLSACIRSKQKSFYTFVPAVEKRDYYTLSPAQKRLYILHRLDENSTNYNMPSVLVLEGDVDRSKRGDVFLSLIRRHESFRTSFHMAVSEPVQQVHDRVEFEMEYDQSLVNGHWSLVNCQGRGEVPSPIKVENIIRNFIRPFDLSLAPLLRVRLIQSGHKKHILLVDMHHIISDGISAQILQEEFLALFTGKIPDPLKLQYKDFSQWQNSENQKEVLLKQANYWKMQLTGEIPLLELPRDYARPAIQHFEGKQISFEIHHTEAEALKSLALAESTTLYMVLLAAYYIFLSKLSNQEDILVGTPTMGRRHADLEQIVGMFVNTLVLRNFPCSHKTYRVFLNQVKEKSLQAFEAQDYPYEELVEVLVQERDTSRNPLFDTMFVMQNMETPQLELPGLKLTLDDHPTETSKFDLTLIGWEAEAKLLLIFEYSTHLFKKETIERFQTYLKRIISAVVTEPDIKIGEINLLQEEEINQLLIEFNDTAADYPAHKILPELFQEQVEKAPDHSALIFKDIQLTYRQLDEKTNQLACRLQEKGAGVETIVGIMTKRSLEMVIGLLGILKAGSAYLPIDPDYPENRINYILKDSGAKILLTGQDIAGFSSPQAFNNRPQSAPSFGIWNLGFGISPPQGGQLAYIIYTSGSSGMPKGVIVEHRSAVNILLALQEEYPLTPSDTYLLKTSYMFDVSVTELFGWYMGGGRLALLEANGEKDPKTIMNTIQRLGVTHINFVPSMFNVFLEGPEPLNTSQLASLKYIFLAGEALLPELVQKFKHFNTGIKMENIYGPTEGTIYSSKYSLSAWDESGSIPIGKPMANTRLYILARNNHLQPVGIPGELCISGPGVARGYLNNPDLTFEKFCLRRPGALFEKTAPGPRKNFLLFTSPDSTHSPHSPHSPYSPYSPYSTIYRTGDLARWLKDGNIEFLGRMDHQVKIRGFRIELSEIESHLLKHEKIKEAVVTSRTNEKGDNYLCAYIIAKRKAQGAGGGEIDCAELRTYLAKKVPVYMIPSYFQQLEEIPLTSSGKVDRKRLHALGTFLKSDAGYVPPGSEIEKIIANIWKDLLQVDQVSIQDHFFEVGGNSLLMIRLSNRLQEAFKRDIPVVTLFEYPTIDSLARYLKEEAGDHLNSSQTGDYTLNQPAQEKKTGMDIAVIGMAGRFPGAYHIHEFWENLKNGVESIWFFTGKELEEERIAPGSVSDLNYVKAKGSLENAGCFDATFFGYSPKEAEIMDPQLRILHECAWNALEDAGYHPGNYNGLIGFYAGSSSNFYWLRGLSPGQVGAHGEFGTFLLNEKDFLVSRVSHKLNLQGPAVVVQTACSTSLAAVEIACQGLISGKCHMALAGGVSLTLPVKSGYLYREGMVFSPDGHCRAFDARARGLVGGNGVGLVVLKRLPDAVSDGDTISAIIKGAAVNNDGSQKPGYTAPSVDGQLKAIEAALKMAHVKPETIGYIETHGSGTPLGDTIEIEALKKVFNTGKKGSCPIGSVKTNIGHLDAAAGIAGLIKTVLVLKHRLIPPSLHVETANPVIDFENSPFYVNTQLTTWESQQIPLRAGISSFGLGGTNAHVILEEAPIVHSAKRKAQRVESQGTPRQGDPSPDKDYQLILLSAKTSSALNRMTQNLGAYFKKNPGLNLADAAYTLQVGRETFRHRKMTVCSSPDEAGELFSSPRSPRVKQFSLKEYQERPTVVFMFPGIGAQYVNMGLGLYREEPLFREEMDHCFEILNGLLDCHIKEILYPVYRSNRSYTSHINQTRISHALIFVFEYALAKLLMAWGIRPDAMIGYSFGEYTTACLSGVFSLEDALKLVVIRAQLIETLPGGGMLSVPMPEKELLPLLPGELSIAIDNGFSCIVAGPAEKLNAFTGEMKRKRLMCMRLPGSHAIHTRMMEPILSQFEDTLGQVELKEPKIPYISNVTGDWLTAEEAADPAYWGKHLINTVQFARGVRKLMEKPPVILVEVGPGRELNTLLLRYTRDNPDRQIVNIVRHPGENLSDTQFLLKRLGLIWLYGVNIDWNSFYNNKKRKRTALPIYPFEKKQFPTRGKIDKYDLTGEKDNPLMKKANIDDWFYVPSWKPSILPAQFSKTTSLPGNCLVFLDECGFGEPLQGELQTKTREVFCVKNGTGFNRENTHCYTIDPRESSHYERLFNELSAIGRLPFMILHLWGISAAGEGQLESRQVEKEQDLGFYSLLHLVQVIGRRDSSRGNALNIVVVTNSMQRLPGEENQYPGKATVLGALKVIHQEYPFVRCRSIDILLPPPGSWQRQRLYNQLLAEFFTETSDPDTVIALRGSDRLIQTYESLPFPSPGALPQCLKHRGVYLVTGGLGGIGLEIAGYLAKKAHARLVLTGRTPFPPKDKWDQWLAGQWKGEGLTPLDIVEEEDNIYQWENQLWKKHGVKGIKSFNGLEETANELCTAYIYEYFKNCHINMSKGQNYEKTKLREQLKILPKFYKLYDFFIRVLVEDGLIREVNHNCIQFLVDPGKVKDAVIVKEEAEKRFPGFKGTFNALEYCASHYKEALNGEIEAISVLFPGNKPIHSQEAYKSSVQYSSQEIYCRLLKKLVLKLLEKLRKTCKDKVKIMEIGAGTGILTRIITRELADYNVQYYFTDIGKYFIINARKDTAYAGLDFISFDVLDISRDPVDQGYLAHDFDMILGLNVVHATRDIAETLGHLKTLLAPGGMIALLEAVQPQRWLNMIDGLAEGWWYFEDEESRKNSPLLELEKWEQALGNQGFKDILLFPPAWETGKRLNADTGLVIAAQDPAVVGENTVGENQGMINKIRKLKQLEALGSEVLILQADVTSREQMQAAVKKTGRAFGPVNGLIHCAGELDYGGVIQRRNREASERVLAPKVRGTLVLNEIFKEAELDFFVLCSSLSSIKPQIGQVAHCAANAFIDAFAHYRWAARGKLTAAINWEAWKEVGSAEESQKRWRQSHDFIDYSISDFALSPAEGIEIFARTLANPLPQVVISTRDLADLLARDNIYEDPLLQEADTAGDYLRPDVSAPYTAPQNRIQQTLVQLWQDFLGIEPVGVRDDFFELGMDSLMAITISAKIHKALEVQVPISFFFSQPTIEGVARYIENARRDNHCSLLPVEKKQWYVLSSAQKRLYILDQMIPGTTLYNETSARTLVGELNKKKLEDTFNKLIQRHESLRTSFHMVDDQPVQRVHHQVEFGIEYYGAERMAQSAKHEVQGIVGNKERCAQGAVRPASFIRPFDLSRAPLLRTALIKTGEKTHLLLVDMHHIISDGVSFGILVRDFMMLYAGEELPSLSLQYKDYSERWNNPVQKERIKSQKNFWLKELTGEIPGLDLPFDYPKPMKESVVGSSITFDMGEKETNALKEIGHQAGASLYMVLLALYNILLSKICNREDIVVGTPVAGRRHADLKSLIGMFVNMLPMRNYPVGEKPFFHFLEEVKQGALQVFENQDYPFEEMVAHMEVERESLLNPLFNVGFELFTVGTQPGELKSQETPGLKLKPHQFETKISRNDLFLYGSEREGKIFFDFMYRTDLFKEETIRKFAAYFKKIAGAVTNNVVFDGGLPLCHIDFLPEEEKQVLLYDFNNTAAEYPAGKTIYQLFAEQVERTPDYAALVESIEEGHLSYKELKQRANQLAKLLIGKGVKPDNIVGIMIERSIEMIIGIFGILKAGAAYLPIDPHYPEERINYILTDSSAKILLNSREIHLSTCPPTGVFLTSTCQVSPANLAYIIYTSGTTGQPKGVAIGHSSLVNRLNWMQKQYTLDERDTILHKTPFTFDVSVWEIFWWAIRGATVCLPAPGDEKDPKAIIDAVQLHQVTIIHFVPSMLSVFLEYLSQSGEEKKLSCLRQVISSGETLTSSLVKRFNDLLYRINSTKLANLYGPTEATIDVSYYNCFEDDPGDFVPIGKPIDNINLFIFDRYFRLQPIGVVGQLCISGVGLARGYLNRPELTAQKFCPLPQFPIYLTGDLARWLPGGNIEFLGRIDHQVKIRGARIELGEIENRLLEHEEIKEVAVVLKVDGKGDKYLCAYLTADIEPGKEELREFLSARLPGYMIPAYFISLEKLPLTSSGKINRRALPAPELVPDAHYVAPRDEIDNKLVEIWLEVLGGGGDIGIDDNFFQLGGHSLKAIVLMAAIQEKLKIRVPTAELFRKPTIRRLSGYIKEVKKSKYFAITAAEKKEYYPLSSAQRRLYLQQQMNPGSTAYNMCSVLLLKGSLDIKTFEKIINQIVDRHETLRTSFCLAAGEEVQRVRDRVDFNVGYWQCSEIEAKEKVEELLKPFTLAHAPLLKVELIDIRREEYFIFLDMHHIISDGTSIEIFVNDFLQLYEGKNLVPLPIQYKDYAAWQDKLLKEEKPNGQASYWLKQLENFVFTQFPIDRFDSYNRVEGKQEHREIESSLYDKIETFCRQHNVTTFALLFTVFGVVLAREIDQMDITIGIPASLREDFHLTHLIGIFLNILLIRTLVKEEETFLNHLESSKTTIIEALNHQDYPYEILNYKIKQNSHLRQKELFSIFFNYFPSGMNRTISTDQFEICPLEIQEVYPKYDMALYIQDIERPDRHMELNLVYKGNIYNQHSMKNFIDNFLDILYLVLEKEHILISQLVPSHAGEDEKDDLAAEFAEYFDMEGAES